MILFTGHGELATAFKSKYDARIESFRKLKFDERKHQIKHAKILIHNAANLNGTQLIDSVKDNFILTKQIIDLCTKTNPNIFFIYLSSMSFLNLNGEYKDIKDMSNYAYSKFLGESYLLKSSLSQKSSIRFSTIFYKNPKRDGLSKLIHDSYKTKVIKLINNGISRRDFIPIEICAGYLKKIIEEKYSKGIINICSGISTSFQEIAAILIQNIKHSRICNCNLESNSIVCSKFNPDDINKIGRIDFSLNNELIKYLESIKNEDSHF